MGKIKKIITYFKITVSKLWESMKSKDFTTAFLATLLGVLFAFWLNGQWHEWQNKKRIKFELGMVYLESLHNARVALDAEKLFGNDPSTPFKRPMTVALDKAFLDINLFKELPYDTIYLLRRYKQRLLVFKEVLMSVHSYRLQNINSNNLPQNIVKPLKHNILDTKVHCALVQDKLKKYYNKYGVEYEDELEQIKEKLKKYKDKAIDGSLEFLNKEYP